MASAMSETGKHAVDRLLHELKSGNRKAFSDLLPLVYDELHRIAARNRDHWEGEETLNTTALLHEAYMRLADQSAPEWQSYPHFLAVASTAMRQILVDYAKRKRAVKRGGGYRRVGLEAIDLSPDGIQGSVSSRTETLIALDDSLRRLEEHDKRQGRIVECRFFGGMTIDETATALGIAPATVGRGWLMAKAWLHRDLRQTLEETA
jgi:RNA polymerase sigma factor (TIGR02999 family)